MNVCSKCGGRVPVVEVVTRREREVIAMLVDEALSNAEIGARLGIDERTVKNHLRKIFSVLGIESRVQLAVWWHTELFQLGLTA